MNKTLLTDLYQLTMMASYFDNDKNDVAVFDYFIRNLPENWGYFIANGIQEFVEYVKSIDFDNKTIRYLRSLALFNENFLGYLTNFKFNGSVWAVGDGTVVFPNEPIIKVIANRMEAQFVETALLNICNYQTMIATKASRIVTAAKGATLIDFGARRAQGTDASIKGARAAYLVGFAGTSNLLAGKLYDIPVNGTMAHSYVMSYPTEVEAFWAYAKTYPDKPTFLIDTYDTISGAKNAVIIAKEMEKDGNRLGAVRIDTEPLGKLAHEVRKILNLNNLRYVKIFVSSDLNEYKIAKLIEDEAPIDGFGVGTEMITAKPISAISGVYKIVEDTSGGKIKLSNGKKTIPGNKEVSRDTENGKFTKDYITLAGSKQFGFITMLYPLIYNGIICKFSDLKSHKKACEVELLLLPDKVKRIINPVKYDVVKSEEIIELEKMIEEKIR